MYSVVWPEISIIIRFQIGIGSLDTEHEDDMRNVVRIMEKV